MLNGVEKEHNRRLEHSRQYLQAIRDNLAISNRPVNLDITQLDTIESHLADIRRLLKEKSSL